MKIAYKIERDDHPFDPREDDNAGVMACWHSRYRLGDDRKMWDCPDDPEAFVEWAKANKVVYLPLYLYDHSGITMRTTPFSCSWDSGQVGYIYLTRETIRKEWDYKTVTKQRRAKLEEYLRAEVSTYDQYLTGDVYGYIITDEDTGEELDSCWGIFGYADCESEAKALVAHFEATLPKQYALPLEGASTC